MFHLVLNYRRLEGSVDNGNVIVTSFCLFVSNKMLILLREGNGDAKEHFGRENNVPSVTGEEVLIKGNLPLSLSPTNLQHGPGGHEDGVEIRDWAAGHDVPPDGRHVPDLLPREPAQHLLDLVEHLDLPLGHRLCQSVTLCFQC